MIPGDYINLVTYTYYTYKFFKYYNTVSDLAYWVQNFDTKRRKNLPRREIIVIYSF